MKVWDTWVTISTSIDDGLRKIYISGPHCCQNHHVLKYMKNCVMRYWAGNI